jgi:hypothetical protein
VRCGQPAALFARDAADYVRGPHRGLVHVAVCPEPPVGTTVRRRWPDGSGAEFHRSLLVGDEGRPPGARWSLLHSPELQWWTWDEIIADGEPAIREVTS